MSDIRPVDIEPLVRRKVIVIDESERVQCCGLDRDEDGLCQHRPGHPVFVAVPESLIITDQYLRFRGEM